MSKHQRETLHNIKSKTLCSSLTVSSVSQLRNVCWRIKPWREKKERGLFTSIMGQVARNIKCTNPNHGRGFKSISLLQNMRCTCPWLCAPRVGGWIATRWWPASLSGTRQLPPAFLSWDARLHNAGWIILTGCLSQAITHVLNTAEGQDEGKDNPKSLN